MESYFETSREFYDTALSHLEAQNKTSEDLSDLSSFLLNWVPFGDKFDEAIDLL